ncbi:hypothetical protein HN011_011360 [Eciton burchellii]|nr:hypothetical protein HN011_011360 [Eciton burchellii]
MTMRHEHENTRSTILILRETRVSDRRSDHRSAGSFRDSSGLTFSAHEGPTDIFPLLFSPWRSTSDDNVGESDVSARGRCKCAHAVRKLLRDAREGNESRIPDFCSRLEDPDPGPTKGRLAERLASPSAIRCRSVLLEPARLGLLF